MGRSDALVNAKHFEILGGGFDSIDIYRLLGYMAGMGLPSTRDRELITEIMLRYAETILGASKGSTALC